MRMANQMRLAPLAPLMASLVALFELNASTWPGHWIHFGHLAQVEGPAGAFHKALSDQLLQRHFPGSDATGATLRTVSGEENCGKMRELLSAKRYAFTRRINSVAAALGSVCGY